MSDPMVGLMQAVMAELSAVKDGLRHVDERRGQFERAALARLEEMQAALDLLKHHHPDPALEISDEEIVDIAEIAAEHDAELARAAEEAQG